MIQVELPVRKADYKLAIIGGTPTKDDEARPFSGVSGRFLDAILARHNIDRKACLVGYITQEIAPYGRDETLSIDSWEVQNGLQELETYLNEFNPYVCLLLGSLPLRVALNQTQSLTNYRGSVFIGDDNTIFRGRKCIATYKPEEVLRQYDWAPIFAFDVNKAKQHSFSSELKRRQRILEINLGPNEIINRLEDLQQRKVPVAIDVEGYPNSGITCISIAESAEKCFVIPFVGPLNGSAWDKHTEGRIWVALAKFLGDSNVPKILQNGMYDRFVLAHTHNIHVSNMVDDTMLMQWELYSELPKGLAFLSSIYTEEPYYKDERVAEGFDKHLLYCAKDSAVTYEVLEAMKKELLPQQQKHYEFNIKMLNPLLYMQLRGIAYNKVAADQTLIETKKAIYKKQHEVNQGAFIIEPFQDPYEALAYAAERLCYKKNIKFIVTFNHLVEQAKPSCYGQAIEVKQILENWEKNGYLLNHDKGKLSDILGYGLNVNSTKQLSYYLYEIRKLPKQFKKENGRLTNKTTTDVLALLNLYKKTGDEFCLSLLELRSLLTATETLSAKPDADMRMRCSYNVVGTETGRLSCYASPTGSGFNLQTVTKKQRKFFIADPGMFIFQCDLAGADGWTVAAHCKQLGDPTMFDDYMAGLKPAKIIALMYENVNNAKLSREELKEACKNVDSDGWLYFASKRVQHGTNYGMGVNTMSDQILKDSYKLTGKPIRVEAAKCRRLQELYLMRYRGVKLWHNKVIADLRSKGEQVSASGTIRKFFGRKTDNATLKKALANEPQQNTTYATNRAMMALWEDPENRVGSKFIIEPLHQVHDALIGQFPQDKVDFARKKLRQWFDIKLIIAGQEVKIPFEGSFGRSWGELEYSL